MRFTISRFAAIFGSVPSFVDLHTLFPFFIETPQLPPKGWVSNPQRHSTDHQRMHPPHTVLATSAQRYETPHRPQNAAITIHRASNFTATRGSSVAQPPNWTDTPKVQYSATESVIPPDPNNLLLPLTKSHLRDAAIINHPSRCLVDRCHRAQQGSLFPKRVDFLISPVGGIFG